jgi:hypothetical protein
LQIQTRLVCKSKQGRFAEIYALGFIWGSAGGQICFTQPPRSVFIYRQAHRILILISLRLYRHFAFHAEHGKY